ncbi:molybdopterin cofactor-binding domain-containing protein [Actibacterium sp. 188UL27-1]|uniref:molybdopterin cofactor-binding domain-containing protein n=1 Tax=Actibacterium sp. 188UL27-1 TaxID=2786961 RepID=UPI002714E685|nr:molybdopterin cofactor-binding domain-containing protein [Actibacterium sp. 188UL27-1]
MATSSRANSPASSTAAPICDCHPTRSSKARDICRGPIPSPTLASNVYCCITNRTPATAMRGFGITAVDFTMECQMDRVAEAVSMDPVELRILNAYRDGDMKAHRRVAKNTALIECCQVAAAKADWAISQQAAAQSSLAPLPERHQIPETVTDEEGKIGERRAGRVASTALSAHPTGRVPAGTRRDAIAGAPVQNVDMQIDADRIGHKMGSTPATIPAPAATAETGPTMPTATPPPAQTARPTASSPAPPPAPPSASSPPPMAPPEPCKPATPFSGGVRRPDSSPVTSGYRKR